MVPALLGVAVGMAISLAVQWSRQRRRKNPLVIEKTQFVTDDRAEISFKRKLRITVRNASDDTIIVGPKTRWIEGDLHVDTVEEHYWQLEGPRGQRNDDWRKEANRVEIAPGQYARTWIGLPVSAVQSEVERLVKSGKAGAISVQTGAIGVLQINIKGA